jgi:5'-nucleotidase
MIQRRVHSRRITLIVILAVAAMMLALLPAGAAGAAKDETDVDFWLTILHNNDGESDLIPSEVLDGDDVIGFQGGVAYFANVLRDARTAANVKPKRDNTKRASIFVSSGDNFLASPSFTASLANGTFYDATALDALKYDAIILGNHDFDFGPDLLADFISEGFNRPGKPPYLSANLDFSGEASLQALVDDGVIAASTVVKVKGEEIGIVGATTPNLPFISSPRNVVVNAVLPAAQDEIDALEAGGIDKIVFVSHLQDVDGDVALATQLSGVDVMVAGGGDELLANPGDPLLPSDLPGDIFGPYPIITTNADGAEVPVVTTSGQYGYVGNLVVGFDDDGNVVALDDDASLPLRVVSESVGPDGVKPNGSFNARVVAPVSEFVAELAANVIGTSEVDLDGRRSPGVRTMETNEGNLIADAMRWQATQLADEFGVPVPDVALQNGGGIRNDSIIPAGDITELDTFDMVPFPNFVTVFPALTRENFKEVLENAVSRTQPGDIPGGTGRFAQVSGFTFTYSGSGTAQVIDPDTGVITTPGTRVQDVVLDDDTVLVENGVVTAGGDISLSIVDFNARGGDQYPFDAPFTVLGASYQQALSNYIQEGLGGLISAVDYPEGGEGRITNLP